MTFLGRTVCFTEKWISKNLAWRKCTKNLEIIYMRFCVGFFVFWLLDHTVTGGLPFNIMYKQSWKYVINVGFRNSSFEVDKIQIHKIDVSHCQFQIHSSQFQLSLQILKWPHFVAYSPYFHLLLITWKKFSDEVNPFTWEQIANVKTNWNI